MDTKTVLGRDAAIPISPDAAQLVAIDNPHPNDTYCARFVCPEFTSLCPVTGQPDFAHIIIDYCPNRSLVESKSLKLYLFSFRNHGAFHEDCTISIAKKILESIQPRWFRISAYWYARGGIPIEVFFQTDEPPKGLLVPDPGVTPYRGRG